MNNPRFLAHDSPYHALRNYTRKTTTDKQKQYDVGRRIVTEQEATTSTNNKRMRTTTHHDVEDYKDENSINNYNNIHINIHHNEFVNTNKKYFPTLQSKLMLAQQQQQKKLSTEESIRTPLSTKASNPRPQRQSSSLHESHGERNKDLRSTSSHITQQPKKRLVIHHYKPQQTTNESFDATHSSNLDGTKHYQNMILSQIRHRRDTTTDQQQQQQQPNSTSNKFTKKGNNFILDTKKPSLLDQSIEIAESQKQYNIVAKQTITPQRTSQHHHSFSQSNNHMQKSSYQSTVQKQQQLKSNLLTPSVKTNSYKSLDPTTNKSTKSKSQERQKTELLSEQPLKVHPKLLWDMSDEEWEIFGDRFPHQFDKKKLLGRGGFSLVWLGEHRKTKETFAIKQILSNNTHQSHMKEIWFGTYFFEGGQPKEKFSNFPGGKNLVRFLAYDVKPQDTWIFYEICGDSLGNHLYDLKGENQGQERIYRIQHRSLYNTLRKDNSLIKKLLSELASALDLLSEQRIVHSDLKTENILIKTERLPNGMHQLSQIKLIDYGSSFPFDDLKQFSMATPEYMCPEILNYILYENSLNYHQSLLKYLVKYQKPWVIDIWSLGCVILEIISGIPLWMSLKTVVQHKGKEQIEYGLFAVKGRVFEKIIERQIEVVSNLDHYLENKTFGGVTIDHELKYLLKRMLSLNPEKRISPKEIMQFLDPTKKTVLHTQ